MTQYTQKNQETRGGGNRYKAMKYTDYSLEEAIHWVGGDLPNLDQVVIDYLIKKGLKQKDVLLEVGCGPLRCSKSIIRYLNTRRYFGIDGDENLINVGVANLDETLRRKKPTFATSWNFEFDLLKQKYFDHILIQAVILHMPSDEISALFKAIATVMHPQTVAHVSFIEGTPKDPHTGIFQYTFNELTKLAQQADLKIKYEGDWGHPRKLKMATLMLK